MCVWSQYSHNVSPSNRDGPGSNKLIFRGTILTIHVLNTPSKTSLTFFFHHWIITTVHFYCLLHQCNKKFPHYSPSFNTHNFLQIAQYRYICSQVSTKKQNTQKPKKQFAYVQNQETKPYFYRLAFPVSGDGIVYRVEKHDLGLFHSSKRNKNKQRGLPPPRV